MLWQRGHFWIAIAGAVLCVLRARFFRLDVRLFGTAMFRVQLNVELSGKLVADCPQRIPTAFGSYRNAVARSVVPVCSTVRAQALAVFPAKGKARYREEPHLSHRRSQIQRRSIWIERIHIGIVLGIFSLGGEDEVGVFLHRYSDIGEASPARYFSFTLYAPAEVKPGRSRGRQTALDP